ncbi:MAG: acyl-CoA thioesterase [Lachnospiraceae bacterium]|nr:acyl-CoA thioesterase [Lachnospiraceae bacterium]
MNTDNHIKPYIHHAKYYETDQMGIVHHSNYIRWMEEARMDAMSQFGISYCNMEKSGLISPVVSVSCQYKAMVHFDDIVQIQVKVIKYNGVRLDFEYEMTDSRTGELRTKGKSTHCFLDSGGQVISLKRDYPEIDACFRKMLYS